MVFVSNRYQADGIKHHNQIILRHYSTRNSTALFDDGIFTKWSHGIPTFMLIGAKSRSQFGASAADNGYTLPFTIYGGELKIGYVRDL
jgi:hypothetical protein